MSQKNFVSFGDAETLMAELASAIADKVDKVNGKDLSTNDYSNADKAIVDSVTSALAGKADISDVPTKTSDLSNDNGFINNLVNDLANYYKKSETYTQAEIDTRIAAITTLDIQAVNALPTEDISTTTIYLVPKQTPSSQDVKDEYINLDGTTAGWEHIGTTEIDLSNYVTTSDLTTALQSYVLASQLTANDTPFRFGYDSNTGKYGYILNKGGADTVVPFKDCDSSEITVTAANQILSGHKDYDSNGNLITGTNAGYDAGVTQGEANMKDGVTVTAASQLLSGYKARTSDGTLVTGSDAGYSAGVTQGHTDRDTGVTVTAADQIVSGYKARDSSGTLLTGTATTGGKVTSEQTKTVKIRSASWSVTFSFSNGVLGIKSMSDCAGIRSISISGNTVSGSYSGDDKDYSMTVVGY